MNQAPLEFSGLLPLWLVIVGALTALLLEVFLKEEGRKALPLVTGTFLVFSLSSVFKLISNRAMPGALFHGAVVVDLYSLTLQGICLLSALLTCVFSAAYLTRERAVTGEYYSLILFAVAGMFVLVLAGDFLTLFVGLELMSLSAYVLAGYLRVRERSIEAALKYFMLGVFASAFLLYGIALLYGASGTLHFTDLRMFMEKGGAALPLVKLAVAFLLVGFGFKVALVPFHGWAPDVYDGAPAPVSAFLSTGVKAAAFGAFARLFAEPLGVNGNWTTVLALLAVLTMTLGNLGALAQTSVKRLLAYSSVAHAGYLMLALTVVSAAPANEVERAVAFYLLAYTLMTAGVFGWLSWAGKEGEKRAELEDFKGIGAEYPWLALPMTLFLFSLAGMTPLAGFFGKFYIFKLVMDHGTVGLVLVAVLNSFVSAYYYLRVAAFLYMKPQEKKESPAFSASFGLTIGLFLCALGSLVVGFLKFPF